MIAGPWFITPHACERYIERIEPSITHPVAIERLSGYASAARRKGLYMGGPAEEWVVTVRPPGHRRRVKIRFVVGPPRGEHVLPQVITILRPHNEWVNPC